MTSHPILSVEFNNIQTALIEESLYFTGGGFGELVTFDSYFGNTLVIGKVGDT